MQTSSHTADLRKSEQRKLEILEAFIESVARHGLEGTSFASVGKSLGMGASHVNYYFRSRTEMIESAVRYVIWVGQAMTVTKIQRADGWRDQVAAWIEATFEWVEQHPKHSVILRLFYYLASFEKSYRELDREIRRTGAERFARMVRPHSEATLAELVELGTQVQGLASGRLLAYLTSQENISFKTLKKRTVEAAFDLIDARLARSRRFDA